MSRPTVRARFHTVTPKLRINYRGYIIAPYPILECKKCKRRITAADDPGAKKVSRHGCPACGGVKFDYWRACG